MPRHLPVGFRIPRSGPPQGFPPLWVSPSGFFPAGSQESSALVGRVGTEQSSSRPWRPMVGIACLSSPGKPTIQHHTTAHLPLTNPHATSFPTPEQSPQRTQGAQTVSTPTPPAWSALSQWASGFLLYQQGFCVFHPPAPRVPKPQAPTAAPGGRPHQPPEP